MSFTTDTIVQINHWLHRTPVFHLEIMPLRIQHLPSANSSDCSQCSISMVGIERGLFTLLIGTVRALMQAIVGEDNVVVH